MNSFLIDCDDCAHQHTETCADCVVTFICNEPTRAVVVDATERLALRRMNEAGLVPALRHQRRTS